MSIVLMTVDEPKKSPFDTSEKRIPLGIAYLISYLEHRKHRVKFFDNYVQRKPWEEWIKNNHVDFVGLYITTVCWQDALKILKKLNLLRITTNKHFKIVTGGPHSSVCPETIPDFVDHRVIGEGEKSLIDIVEGRVQDSIIIGEKIENLDTLLRPAWHHFIDNIENCEYDLTAPELENSLVFNLNTSRGCPFSCNFCSVSSIWGRTYRAMSVDKIIDEIQFLQKTYGANGIYFREDNFTVSKKRTIELCENLMRKGIRIRWMCETRVDTVDYEVLSLMKNAGCEGLYVGIESGSQEILDKINKGITVEQIEEFFEATNKIGIKVYASMLIGTPYESESDRRRSIELIEKYNPYRCGWNVFVGIPKSQMYYDIQKKPNHVDENGLIISSEWRELRRAASIYTLRYKSALFFPKSIVNFLSKINNILDRIRVVRISRDMFLSMTLKLWRKIRWTQKKR